MPADKFSIPLLASRRALHYHKFNAMITKFFLSVRLGYFFLIYLQMASKWNQNERRQYGFLNLDRKHWMKHWMKHRITIFGYEA
jgi:hypothetical protein